MIMDGNMDLEKLKFIISMARDVKNNRISEHSASVEVGKKYSVMLLTTINYLIYLIYLILLKKIF